MSKSYLALFILLIFILGNLFIIDVAFFLPKKSYTSKPIDAATTNKNLIPTTTPSENCADECKALIKKEVAKALLAQTPIQQQTLTTSVKESFITLGSGSSTDSDWTDVAGVQTYIDSSAYGRIKSVTFEVSLDTPTGNQSAYARLFNITDKHPVWNSEVSIEGGTPQLKISNPITLGAGSKLYQVQMKTQLQARTNLENARVHITTY